MSRSIPPLGPRSARRIGPWVWFTPPEPRVEGLIELTWPLLPPPTQGEVDDFAYYSQRLVLEALGCLDSPRADHGRRNER